MEDRRDDLTRSYGPDDASTRSDLEVGGDQVGRPTRRRLMQGAALTVTAVGAAYVKPSIRTFALPVALAASGGPVNTCAPYNPCSTDADCPSGQTCDPAGCCKPPDIITF